LGFLKQCLDQHGLSTDVLDKYVQFNQGGELGCYTAVVDLILNASYKVKTTAPDSSHQISLIC
jgi:hypothetical protein